MGEFLSINTFSVLRWPNLYLKILHKAKLIWLIWQHSLEITIKTNSKILIWSKFSCNWVVEKLQFLTLLNICNAL